MFPICEKTDYSYNYIKANDKSYEKKVKVGLHLIMATKLTYR